MIRVLLPSPLRALARVDREVEVDVPGAVTVAGVLDAVEAKYPMLLGTMRDQVSRRRRPFIRFYAGEEDVSQQPADSPLPPAVVSGSEPLVVIGAMAGG